MHKSQVSKRMWAKVCQKIIARKLPGYEEFLYLNLNKQPMIKLQPPRGPMYGQGKFLWSVFIVDPDEAGEHIMFTFRSENHLEEEVQLEAIKLGKNLFKWREEFADNVFLAYVELIGEIIEN